MSDRNRSRSTAAVKERVELPETVTLYPDAHFIPGEPPPGWDDIPPREVLTVSREQAMHLLAIGRRRTNENGSTTPAWDGDEICPAYHLEIQLARFEDQRGPDAPQWADWPESDTEPDTGPPDNPADQAADQTTESPA